MINELFAKAKLALVRVNLALRDFLAALLSLKITKKNAPALWAVIASMIFLGTAQPTAYGLEFPMTTRLVLPNSSNLTSKNLTVKSGLPMVSLSSQMSEMAIVAELSRQVELARTKSGAKKVAREIMKSEYKWGEYQYGCLEKLWTRESHWNYKAHNRRSGAHGIPQALPAVKMDVVADDWRTNPVTQIRWGLRYIDIRYETPCRAWSKFSRSHYY
ncbi:MLTF_like domain containing protein [Candidatus Nanopelagicaceae bacterium]